MRPYEIAVAAVLAAAAIAVILFVFSDRGDAPVEQAVNALPTPEPARIPSAVSLADARLPWVNGLRPPLGDAVPVLLSCLDTGDGRLTGDDPGVPAGVDIALTPGSACSTDGVRAEWYVDPMLTPEALQCGTGPPPVRVIAIGGGGTDLLDASLGESTGFLDIVNAIQQRSNDEGRDASVTLAASAVFDAASEPQAAMERWIIAWLGEELANTPCLRAVILGHSHGGATVTQVTSALDGAYGDRMLGVLVDRTIALYDRPVDEWPARTPILNYYQLNEGWHGVPIDLPNVTNIDESSETAPVPSAGGEGPAGIVDHTTLDDAPATQQRIVAAVMAWLTR